MFMVRLSTSMRQTLLRHVYTLYIHVYVIWPGFQMSAPSIPSAPAVNFFPDFLERSPNKAFIDNRKLTIHVKARQACLKIER